MTTAKLADGPAWADCWAAMTMVAKAKPTRPNEWGIDMERGQPCNALACYGPERGDNVQDTVRASDMSLPRGGEMPPNEKL